jgi:hypothetical protein
MHPLIFDEHYNKKPACVRSDRKHREWQRQRAFLDPYVAHTAHPTDRYQELLAVLNEAR